MSPVWDPGAAEELEGALDRPRSFQRARHGRRVSFPAALAAISALVSHPALARRPPRCGRAPLTAAVLQVVAR